MWIINNKDLYRKYITVYALTDDIKETSCILNDKIQLYDLFKGLDPDKDFPFHITSGELVLEMQKYISKKYNNNYCISIINYYLLNV